MEYNKINKILTDKRLSIPQLADKIGMTKRGLYSSIENKTLTISTLEKIAEVLDVPVTVFFDEQSANWNNKDLIAKNTKLDIENQDLEERISELNDQLIDKKKIIKFTEKTLSEILDYHTKFTKSLIEKKDIKMLSNPEFQKLSDLIIYGIPAIVFQGYTENEDINKLVNMTIEAYNKANPENPIISPEKEQFNQ